MNFLFCRHKEEQAESEADSQVLRPFLPEETRGMATWFSIIKVNVCEIEALQSRAIKTGTMLRFMNILTTEWETEEQGKEC